MAFLDWFRKKPVKLCKNCKYCIPSQLWAFRFDCQHKKSLYGGKFNFITGNVDDTKYSECLSMRDFKCGKRAKYFEHIGNPEQFNLFLPKPIAWHCKLYIS